MRAPTFPLAITLVLLTATLGGLAPPAAAQTEGAHAVSGRVVSDAGDPVAGAIVDAHVDRSDGAYKDSATTAEDGTFTLHLDAGKARLNVWYDAWRANAQQELAIDGDVTGLEIVLLAPPPKTATIEGRVVDEQGNPVEGAIVEVWQACCYAYEDTPQREPATPPPADADAGEGTSGSAGSSDGAAVSSDRAIAPGYYPYDGGERATTDADGVYRVATYPGPRQINVQAKGYAHDTLRVDAVEGETVRGDVTLLKVPDADAVVKGRVVDARTGAPLAGAWVHANNLAWSRWENVETGADGAFEIRTLPGWTQVGANHHPRAEPAIAEGDAALSIAPGMGFGQQYYAYVKNVDLASGETVLEIRLEPKPQPTLVLLGYVIDPAEKAGIPGASVSFWNQDTGDWGQALTDATGSYKILVRAGHYQVTAWAQGYLGGASTLTVDEDDAQTRFDLAMPKGTPRHAPCDACWGGGGWSGVAESGDARTLKGSAPVGAPAPTTATASDMDGARGANPGGDAIAYQGTGGGLPPYDPAQASQASTGAGEGTTGDGATRQEQKVPFAGLALLVAALGAAALALRRR